MNTLIDLFRRELLHIAGFAESTVETYSASVGAFCEFAEERGVGDPLAARGSLLLDWLGSVKQGISRSRLRQHQFAIKSFFAFLDKLGVIEKNPAAALPRIGGEYGEKNTAVPEEAIFSLLDAVEQTTWLGRRNHLIVAMLWCLGLRISELIQLTVGSFEPDHDPGNRIGLLRVQGKNKKQRALFVVDALYDELCDYLADPDSPVRKSRPLFPAGQGGAISASRIQKFLKGYTGSAAIQTAITPHRLRHSFASDLYRLGVPASAIQAMLGHTRQAETAIYIHVPDNMRQTAMAKLAIFGGQPCR